MQSPLYLEVYAQDVMRERRNQAANDALVAQLPRAANDALVAQLPRSPFPRPDLAARLRLAAGLRALAVRLDPCAGVEPVLVAMRSR
jgi:hypothetical protein